jgi:hypothetical protein
MVWPMVWFHSLWVPDISRGVLTWCFVVEGAAA